jgi:hypothetical protein
MDAQRRTQIAAMGRALLPQLQAAVVESWSDLLPAAAQWSEPSFARATRASRAALEGMIRMFEQGDLDDRSWSALRDVVHGQGHATPDEVAELLRTVRIVGVELLTSRLEERLGLGHDELWELQEQAHTFCREIVSTRDEPDLASLDRMLADLERSGPDLR